MLQVSGLETYYGSSQALFGMALDVRAGEVVTLLGRNGMGKTTTINTVMGILKPRAGTIQFQDTKIAGIPSHRIAKMGIASSQRVDRCSRT